MSGLVKAKEYKLEDSNVEKLGGKEHKDAVKQSAIDKEPAWRRWKEYLSASILTGPEAKKDKTGCPHHVEIWRIEKFKVKFWPREQHGQFYSGDSYIILHTYKEEDKVKWDLHFWLGKDTTQDEMGTAAYKTVELDTLLEDGPVQHREVQEFESGEFLNIFSEILAVGGIRYLEGGVDTGFKHVEPEKYRSRLMHLKGHKKIRISEVALDVGSLNSGDVFILDAGLKIYVFIGKSAGMFEKNKAREVSGALKTERKGKAELIGIAEGDTDENAAEFFKLLGGSCSSRIKTAEQGGKDDEAEKDAVKKLFRVSDATGSLRITSEGEGAAVNMKKLDRNDCFVLDIGGECFVWVGKGATQQEKDNAIPLAQAYLKEQGRPPQLSITRVLDGGETKPFLVAMGAI